MSFNSGHTKESVITAFLSTNNLSTDNTFRLIRSTTDKSGITHDRYQQYYKGIKVEFGTLITHRTGSQVHAINAEVYDASRLELTPSLSSKNSLYKAMEQLQIKKASWINSTTKTITDEHTDSELVIIPNYDDNLKSVVLAYKFKIVASEPYINGNSYINAKDGNSVLFNPITKHHNRDLHKSSEKKNSPKVKSSALNHFTAGTADTRYLGQRTIETREEADGTFTLNDDINKVYTRDALNGDQNTGTYLNNFEEFIDNDNNWTAAEYDNTDFNNAALDAHFGASKVKEYWDTVHNRDSYDGNGADLISYVHVGTNYFNAFWNGSAMSYGDGNSNPLSTLDICAHEIGHAVTQTTADLVYANQSGGLNEGYSDIWGAAIQHYVVGSGTDTAPDISVWDIGEDIGAIRSMSNPKAFGDPDTYLGTNWTTTGDEGNCVPSGPNDQCGVHSNSGVLNHWFYILVSGKAGTNDAGDTYNVSGIGMKKAEEVAYLTLRDYLTPNATFLEARNASLTVARNLYCIGTEYQEVQNAWYAVNVGDEFVAVDDDVLLQSVTGSTNVNCDGDGSFSPKIMITNLGTNPITSVDVSYTINGGTPVNEVISTNLAICESSEYSLSPINSLPTGINVLSVTTTVVNDGRPENNTQSSSIIINDSGAVNTVNTFENTSDALVAYNEGDTGTSLWERGIPSGTLLQHSDNVYATNLDGNHPDLTKAYLVSQCYDLSNLDGAELKFKMGFDLEENWDIIYVEYSIDGGENWNILGTSSDPNWYNSDRTNASSGASNDCQNCPGAQWTGEGEDTNPLGTANAILTEYSYLLSDFDANSPSPASNIIFRFVFHSDAAVNEEGVIIDDFSIASGNVLTVEENSFQKFSSYPNPTEGILNLSLTPDSIDENIDIIVSDLRGRNVFNKSYKAVNNFTTTLDLHTLNPGMYLMTVNQGSKSRLVKLMIK